MFSFLNTVLLFALPAALLPLIIHLFTRRRLREVPFSSLTFLKVLQRQRMRAVKLYRWLLLAVRTLIIALLVLAFARPALKGVFGTGFGARARSTVVVLLDTSGSMAADTRDGILADRSRQRALEVLSLLEEDDRAHLVVFNDRIDFVNDEPTMNRAWLRDIITDAGRTNRATDAGRALREAARLIDRSTDVNREVFVISDLAWGDVGDSVAFTRGGVTVYLAGPAGDGAENTAVTASGPDNQIFAVSRPLRIRGSVGHFGTGSPVNLPVRLYVNGERVNESMVTVPAGGTDRTVLGFLPEHPGRYGGYVEIGEDALAADNRRHFVLDIPDRIRVLVVFGDAEGAAGPSRFLEYALAPRTGAAVPVGVRRIRQSDLARVSLNDYDVVMLADAGALTGVQERQLSRFAATGGGLVVFPGSASDPRSLNRLLNAAGGIRLLQPEGIPGRTESFYRFKRIDYGHPVFRGLVEREGQLESPHVYARYRLGVPADAARIIGFGDGSTALAALRNGTTGGSVFVFAFGIDPAWSNFAVRASFVPLLYRMVQYAVSGTGGARQCEAGQPYAGTFAGLPAGGTVTVRLPDGQMHTVPVAGGGGAFTFPATDAPGMYTVLHGGDELGRFAVTFPAAESDLRPSGEGRIRALAGNARVVDAADADDLAALVKNARYGREVFGEAVWLLLALVALETALALAGRTGRGRRTADGGFV